MYGYSDDEIAAIRGGSLVGFEPAEAALLRMADAMADTPSNVSDELYYRVAPVFFRRTADRTRRERGPGKLSRPLEPRVRRGKRRAVSERVTVQAAPRRLGHRAYRNRAGMSPETCPPVREALSDGTPDKKGIRHVSLLETDEMRVVAEGIAARSFTRWHRSRPVPLDCLRDRSHRESASAPMRAQRSRLEAPTTPASSVRLRNRPEAPRMRCGRSWK